VKLKITIDGKSYEAEVEILDEPRIAAYPPLPLTAPPPQVSEKSTDDACLSPVMGLVMRVNVARGETVRAGAVVMVLEAMKMETNIAAPRDGVIKEVHVQAGDSVKMDQLLIEFE
jgi:methylmalonyl-CoA carboxyltransferase small subunit